VNEPVPLNVSHSSGILMDLPFVYLLYVIPVLLNGCHTTYIWYTSLHAATYKDIY